LVKGVWVRSEDDALLELTGRLSGQHGTLIEVVLVNWFGALPGWAFSSHFCWLARYLVSFRD